MTWLYKDEPFDPESAPEDCAGFVYRITNLDNDMKYIGKKIFWRKNKVKVKGKTRRKTVIKESDWRKYYGSSANLKEEIQRIGTDNYKREILHLCKTRGEMSYWEAKLQFEYDVLLRDDYYNALIMCRINASHLKFNDEEDEE